jgi:hypothetical protein
LQAGLEQERELEMVLVSEQVPEPELEREQVPEPERVPEQVPVLVLVLVRHRRQQ